MDSSIDAEIENLAHAAAGTAVGKALEEARRSEDEPEGSDPKQAVARLREQGIDVVRVSYSDLIGVDRGRDVLVEELERVAGHGLAFCRAVYHTSPRGDVVPVPGG